MVGSGRLYVVATPIGNLEDITLRALNILRSVRYIGAETPARIRKLLSYYNIPLSEKHIIVVREDRREKALEKLVEILSAGEDVCVVSDAGTPGISDPGVGIIDEILQRGFSVIPVPGPSSLTAILSVCPLRTPWVFLGFLPRRRGRRRKILSRFMEEGIPVIFFESPHRIGETITVINEMFGNDVTVCIGRELTKVYEEVVVGSPQDVLQRIRPVGEFVVVLKPGDEE
jgi:16S rRNA (cytidine1402-2'-O)-methyltransferase